MGRLRGRRLRGRHPDARPSSAARSTTRSSRRTSPGRASAPARSTSSSRTGATPTSRRSSSPSPVTAARWTFGATGNVGIIGWYVPPWLAEEHPEVLDCKNLNDYRQGLRDVGVRRQGPVPRRGPVVRPVRRGDHQQPRPRLQGRLLRQRGGQHHGLPAGRGEQGVPDRLLLRAAVALRRRRRSSGWSCRRTPTAARTTRPRSTATTRRRTLKKIVSTSWVDEGGPAVDLVKAFAVDQRRPERRGEVHLRGRHDARGRRREVDRREPGQGRRLARLSRTRPRDLPRPGRGLTSRPGPGDP